jgi:membrane-bound serine protease (ClpP class)
LKGIGNNTELFMRQLRKYFLLLLILVPVAAFAQRTQVMVMEIKAEIDPSMRRYVNLALDHAQDVKADIVIIEMDTYGGALQDAKEIVDRIVGFEKPVWVFINRDAASAGAMISLACDSIYMARAATIGAATVVVGGSGEKAPDKYQSYARTIMRSLAEENHRNPDIAEKMVDESLALDSISPAGKVITFSTDQAIKYGFCEAKAENVDEILSRNKIDNYDLIHFELSAVEEVIALFLNPFVSGLLILLFIGGLYFELQTPGVGFPGLAALVALILYLTPYYLAELAAAWEIIALLIGIGLIAVEIFIIPGFGVAGIAGISLTVMSLILIMIDNDFFNFDFVPGDRIIAAGIVALSGLLGGIILLFVGGSRIIETKAFQKIALMNTQSKEKGYTSSFTTENMRGRKGVAHTILRPAGKVLIDGKVYDAYTSGEFIDQGEAIEIIGEETTSLRVKKIPSI